VSGVMIVERGRGGVTSNQNWRLWDRGAGAKTEEEKVKTRAWETHEEGWWGGMLQRC